MGAPRDNVTDSSPTGRFSRPGVVYQCPFTSSTYDCLPILIDREGTLPITLLYMMAPSLSVGATSCRWEVVVSTPGSGGSKLSWLGGGTVVAAVAHTNTNTNKNLYSAVIHKKPSQRRSSG